MKSLLIIFSLVGGFFATDDTAIEFGNNNVRGNAMHEQFNGYGEGFALTAEEEALRTYVDELKEAYDFYNLTVEEQIAAMDEIHELVIIKAEELGVDTTSMIERFEERKVNFELHNSPEWIEFREYKDQLFLDYDLENLSLEEKILVMDEIHELMIVKATELELDITEIQLPKGQGRQSGRPGQGGNHEGRSEEFSNGFDAGRTYQKGYSAGRRSEGRMDTYSQEA